jgi:hypothetical protein
MKAKTIGALCAAIGICGVAAIPASASVDPDTASRMCTNTYVLRTVPEFANPTYGQWKDQDRFIAVARGGDYNASSTYNVSKGYGNTSGNNILCDEDYSFIDAFGAREHIYISGGVSVGTYSDGTRYPAAFWTINRSCSHAPCPLS